MNFLQRLFQAPQNLLQQPQAQGAVPMMDNASMRVAQAAGTVNPNMPPMPGAMNAQPGLMDRFKQFRDGDRGQYLGDMFAGMAMGSTPGQSIGMGAAMAREGRNQRKGTAQERDRLNQTVEYLKGQGLDPDSAALVASNPQTLQEFLKQRLMPDEAQANEYGLTPQYGVDESGNPVLIQLGKDGTAQRTALPAGVTLSKEPIKFDAGTHFVLLDPITRQPVGQIAKENYQESYEKGAGAAQGKADAERAVTAPADITEAQRTIQQIDELLVSPGLSEVTGRLDQYRPGVLMSDKGRDALTRLDQLQGRAFLAAFETLKGGGQITEVEGKKAEQAMARMQRSQGDEEFKAALREFRDAVQQGLQKLQSRGGGAAPAAGGGKRLIFNPQTGELE